MSSARPPLTLMVLSDTPVVSAGVTTMLAPYSQRIAVSSSRGWVPASGEADVLLLDVFGDPDPTARVTHVATGAAAPVIVFGPAECRDQIDPAALGTIAGFLDGRADGLDIVMTAEAATADRPTPPAGERGQSARSWPGHDHGLTAREADVLGLVVAGLSNQDVASRLFLSINSVKSYIRSAYRKMGVTSRSQAVLWGLEHGFDVSPRPVWHTEAL